NWHEYTHLSPRNEPVLGNSRRRVGGVLARARLLLAVHQERAHALDGAVAGRAVRRKVVPEARIRDRVLGPDRGARARQDRYRAGNGQEAHRAGRAAAQVAAAVVVVVVLLLFLSSTALGVITNAGAGVHPKGAVRRHIGARQAPTSTQRGSSSDQTID